MATLAVTDLALNCYYQFVLGFDSFQVYQFVNYAVYALLIGLGQCFNPQSSWLRVTSGGILGALLFYLITNTAAWFFNPFGNLEYTKDLAGWIIRSEEHTSELQSQ